MNKTLVTGGAGFIGSALVHYLINSTGKKVINVDTLVYAGNLESLKDVFNDPGHIFEQVGICGQKVLQRVFIENKADVVMHLAAESHVDRSIEGPSEFIQTNIIGTYNMLEMAYSPKEHHINPIPLIQPVKVNNIKPIDASDYPTKVKRPMDSRLKTNKLEGKFNVTMPRWESALDLCMEEIQ